MSNQIPPLGGVHAPGSGYQDQTKAQLAGTAARHCQHGRGSSSTGLENKQIAKRFGRLDRGIASSAFANKSQGNTVESQLGQALDKPWGKISRLDDVRL